MCFKLLNISNEEGHSLSGAQRTAGGQAGRKSGAGNPATGESFQESAALSGVNDIAFPLFTSFKLVKREGSAHNWDVASTLMSALFLRAFAVNMLHIRAPGSGSREQIGCFWCFSTKVFGVFFFLFFRKCFVVFFSFALAHPAIKQIRSNISDKECYYSQESFNIVFIGSHNHHNH